MRAAIIILGHNLLQQVKAAPGRHEGGQGLLRTKSVTDLRNCSSAWRAAVEVWARANFGTDPTDFPELNGRLPEQVTWSLVYDTTDPRSRNWRRREPANTPTPEKFFKALAAAVEAYGNGDSSGGVKELAAGDDVSELPGAAYARKPSPEFVRALIRSIDWHEAAERCGLPMKGGEESYSQDDDDEAELAGIMRLPARKRQLLLLRHPLRRLRCSTVVSASVHMAGRSASRT